MTNKEVIDRLQKYYLDQNNPELIARLLAAMMVDICRIKNIASIPQDELASLIFRIEMNYRAVKKFIEDGDGGKLNVIDL